MISRDSHGPAFVAPLQINKESSSIVDVHLRVEHFCGAGKLLFVPMMIDLHTAEINQLLAAFSRPMKNLHGLSKRASENRFSLDIESIRLQRSLASGFCQTD